MSLHKEHLRTARRLAQLQLFREMDSLQTILRSPSVMTFSPGEVLYEAQAAARALLVVTEGAVQIESPKTGEVRGRVAALVPAPYLLGAAQILHSHRWSGTGVALVETAVTCLTRETVEALLLEGGSFALSFCRQLSLGFLQAIESRKVQQHADPSHVIADYLLSLRELYQYLGMGIEHLQVTQSRLARACGLRRETVNRAIKKQVAAGAVATSQSGIQLLAPELLLPHGLTPTLFQPWLEES